MSDNLVLHGRIVNGSCLEMTPSVEAGPGSRWIAVEDSDFGPRASFLITRGQIPMLIDALEDAYAETD